MRSWTLGRTITIGFAAVVALNLVVASIALVGLRNVVARKDRVIDTDSRLVLDVQKLLTIRDARAAANRGFLISNRPSYLAEQYRLDGLFQRQLDEIGSLVDTAKGRRLLSQVASRQSQFVVLDRTPVRLRQQGAPEADWTAAWEQIDAQRLSAAGAMDGLFAYEQAQVSARQQEASRAAGRDVHAIVAVLIASALAAAALAGTLARRLRTKIVATVSEVQSSSVELHATANQQSVGAMEQAMAVTQISTTISQLLASSRQIAESAQRVAGAADQTADAGLAGRSTVAAASASMAEIRQQVDTIVGHMMELGERSQRIGSVLDIVDDLAEQTNILAINSTIEAAGAGESGRRFAVVADEIRKLADRVAESTKQIRGLIDMVRGSVDTTVMATELGSKAVDAGTVQVQGVAETFEQIVALVSTTTRAAREIELSTGQQTIAVGQVNLAITNVAQTTRESEATSGQTLDTAAQLTRLSTQLRALVQSGPGDQHG